MAHLPPRPPTPQAMVHRLPDTPSISSQGTTKPARFIILVEASTAVAGKLQIAKLVAEALDCPFYQGDSMHESSAKAATIGTQGHAANTGRYQRMWLSKMTRTGLLFPEESRPAGAEFSGFGGSSSRRNSSSSEGSAWSQSDGGGSVSTVASSVMMYGGPKRLDEPAGGATVTHEALGVNPALLLTTHPELEGWHRECIRNAVGEYGIGVIFVPLDNADDEDEPPLLRAFDPRAIPGFHQSGPALNAQRATSDRDWSGELTVKVDVDGSVDKVAGDAAAGLREMLDA